MRPRKLLLVHHFPLTSVTGVTILITEMLKLVPSLDPGIEVAYQHYEAIANAEAMERELEAAHAEAAWVVGVNLHIEVQWELSLALVRWSEKRRIPLFNYVQDYWPHHEENLRQLTQQHGVRLLGASRFILDSIGAAQFQATLLPMGAQIPTAGPTVSSASPKIIASIGRLVRRKRFPDIVRAFETAALGASAQLRLTLIPSRVFANECDDAQLQLIRQAIKTPSRIELITSPTIPPDYSSLSAYVAASDYEGFSMIPFEAAYSGCPPIVSDIPPHKLMAAALFAERAEDFLYPTGNTGALAERLRDEISTGRRRSYLRSRQTQVRELIEREFSVHTTAKALVGLCRETVPPA